MSRAYAGVGARITPPIVLDYMRRMATRLEELGFILRTGGAIGAEGAFAGGVLRPEMRQVYLPWARFNNHNSELYHHDKRAIDIAADYHPAWDRLKPGSRLLMACNSTQVLGSYLDDPVMFVVTWTPDGAEDYNTSHKTGEAGQVIRLAHAKGIPVFNLQRGKARAVDLGRFLIEKGIISNLTASADSILDEAKTQGYVEKVFGSATPLLPMKAASSHGKDDAVDGDEDDEEQEEWEEIDPDAPFDPDDPEWEYEELDEGTEEVEISR